jgi:hypothetical protein
MSEHESISDMISLIRDVSSSHRHKSATKVLEILSSLLSHKLTKRLKRLEQLKTNYSISYYRPQAARLEPEIVELQGLLSGLDTHKQAICDYLVYRALHSPVLDKD